MTGPRIDALRIEANRLSAALRPRLPLWGLFLLLLLTAVTPTATRAQGTTYNAARYRLETTSWNNPSDSVVFTSIKEYIELVVNKGIVSATQRFEIPISQALELASTMMDDPTITGQLNAFDLSNAVRMPSVYSLSLAQSIPLWGKLDSRERLARKLTDVQRARVREFFHQLKANAADAFSAALAQAIRQDLIGQMLTSFTRVEQLVADRWKLGEIAKPDYLQTRLEMQKLATEYLAAQAQFRSAVVTMNQLSKSSVSDRTMLLPVGSLVYTHLTESLYSLLDSIEQRRPELEALRLEQEAALLRVENVVKERRPAFELQLGVSYTSLSANVVAPSPHVLSPMVGISSGLPFFTLQNQAPVEVERLNGERQQILRNERLVSTQAFVRQAFDNSRTLDSVARLYREVIVPDAETVFSAVEEEFRQGHCSLVQVLLASRTKNEIVLQGLESALSHIRALIELSRHSGSWSWMQ